MQLIAEPNSRVDVDMPLLQLEDPLLDMRVKALQSRESQLQVRYEALQPDDPLEAKILAEQLRHARADLELSRDKQRHLLVRSTHSGRWILPNPQDMEGQFVKKGQILGYVAQLDSPVVRVIVSEDRTELVRNRTERVELRFSDHMGSVFEAVVEREVPALSDMLPSIALSTVGGGEVALDPTDPQQLKVLAKLMHLELRPAQALSVSAIGGRVYVRFDHGYEPIAWRIYRATRQVFMKQLNV